VSNDGLLVLNRSGNAPKSKESSFSVLEDLIQNGRDGCGRIARAASARGRFQSRRRATCEALAEYSEAFRKGVRRSADNFQFMIQF